MAMKRAAWRGVAIGAGLMMAAWLLMPRPVWTQEKPHLEQFSAFAVNLQGAKPGDRTSSGVIQITIDRWSTEAERNTLIDAFSKGQEMGWFEHGSTIIVFAPKGFALCENVREGTVVRMGQPLMRVP